MSNPKRYPLDVLQMQHFEGFNKKFEQLLAKMPAQKAYEATEDIFYYWFLRTRYSNYESFRKIRERHLKKGMKFLS